VLLAISQLYQELSGIPGTTPGDLGWSGW